jgi:hypothetical protein
MSKRALSDIPDSLPHASAACRPRALRGDAIASLLIDPVYAPLRRWGSQTGRLWVWGRCLEGRKGGLRVAPAHSERSASGLAGLRARSTRGLWPPVTIPTDGAPGRSTAIDFLGPRWLRMRCGLPTRQPLATQGPASAGPACTALGAARRDAPTFAAGPRRCHGRLDQYQGRVPAACRCLAEEPEAHRHHRTVPPRHRPEGRTATLAARACAEKRRRTTVRPPLWDDARLRTRVCAVLIRGSARWGKPQWSALAQPHIRALRQSRGLAPPLVPPALVTRDRRPRRSAASAEELYREKRLDRAVRMGATERSGGPATTCKRDPMSMPAAWEGTVRKVWGGRVPFAGRRRALGWASRSSKWGRRARGSSPCLHGIARRLHHSHVRQRPWTMGVNGGGLPPISRRPLLPSRDAPRVGRVAPPTRDAAMRLHKGCRIARSACKRAFACRSRCSSS